MFCVKRFPLLCLLALLAACSSLPGAPPTSGGRLKMPEAAFFQALALMEKGQWAAAETAFLALSTRFPDYSGPWTNLGFIAAAKGDDAEAVRHLEKAIAVNPENAVAMTALGTLLYRRGDHSGALAWNQRAISLRPDYADAHLNLAVLFDKALHQPSLALQHYRRYQSLTLDEDLAVAAWILELEQGHSSSDYKVVSK